MANQHKEKLRGARGIDDQLWNEFDTTAKQVDSDRSALLRAFIEWHVRRPGAELPHRPEPLGTQPIHVKPVRAVAEREGRSVRDVDRSTRP